MTAANNEEATAIREAALREWCDKHLTSGTYCSWMTVVPGDGTLIYRDGSACSATHVNACVYKQDDGTYVIRADCGQARFMGDDSTSDSWIPTVECSTLFDVVARLGNDFSTSWAPTTCGEMIEHLERKGKSLADFDPELVSGHEVKRW